MKDTFQKDVREFVFSRTDKVHAEHLSTDERYENASRAMAAFDALLKTKVPNDVYGEVHSAFLELEALINVRATRSEFTHYWEGFRDGLNITQTTAGELYDMNIETERENRRRDRQIVKKLERAAANGSG